MIEPGRKFVQGVKKYRYGFNGKENDNEIKGEGNQQDYGMRIYDPRLGRFLSEDPITKKYPELTPYQFASNRPIQGIDLDGLEVFLVTGSANAFAGIFGLEVSAGLGISHEGIALVAGVANQIGIGIEAGVGVNFTIFPTMKEFKSLDDPNSYSSGISGGFLGKFGVGLEYSDGHFGGTVSYGVGIGAKITYSVGGKNLSAMKVIKWDEIVKYIKSDTRDAQSLKKALNITGNKNENTVQIVKDYFKQLETDFISKRKKDLNNEINNAIKSLKTANDFLDDYNKSSKIYKFFAYKDKVAAEIARDAAAELSKKKSEELTDLEKVQVNF